MTLESCGGCPAQEHGFSRTVDSPIAERLQPLRYAFLQIPDSQSPSALHPALFLDRDGVVNHEVGYLHLPSEVRFVDGIFPLCRTAQSLGYRLVIVTNQSGIARGLYSTEQFEQLMTWMRAEFTRQDAPLDAVYHCPYHPEHGVGEFKREHEDRKPSPGMFLRASRDHALDLQRSVLVGDRCSDIAAASAANLRQAFLLAGTEPVPCPGRYLRIVHLDQASVWLTLNPWLPGLAVLA